MSAENKTLRKYFKNNMINICKIKKYHLPLSYLITHLNTYTIMSKQVKKNDTNNHAKRTAGQVTAILRSNGVNLKAENQGDGRLFCVISSEMLDRIRIKQAGFILERSNEGAKVIYFKAF